MNIFKTLGTYQMLSKECTSFYSTPFHPLPSNVSEYLFYHTLAYNGYCHLKTFWQFHGHKVEPHGFICISMVTNKGIYPYGYFEAFIMQNFECPQKLMEKLNEPPCAHHTGPQPSTPEDSTSSTAPPSLTPIVFWRKSPRHAILSLIFQYVTLKANDSLSGVHEYNCHTFKINNNLLISNIHLAFKFLMVS